MEEYLNIYNENNVSIDEIRERKLVHELGFWHREVEIWIINEKNELLIQQRSANKVIGANKWAITAGHVTSKESLIEAAIRESEEEVGLKKLSPSNMILFDIRKSESNHGGIKNNCYKYCYILKTNFKQNDFVLQKDEVSKVKYITLEKLKNLSDEEKDAFVGILKSSELKEVIEKLEKKLNDLKEE